jgi:hypothetical protein
VYLKSKVNYFLRFICEFNKLLKKIDLYANSPIQIIFLDFKYPSAVLQTTNSRHWSHTSTRGTFGGGKITSRKKRKVQDVATIYEKIGGHCTL